MSDPWPHNAALRHRRLWRSIWLTACAATLTLSLLPLPPIPLQVDHLDKWQHGLGYALLAAYAVMLFDQAPARHRALLFVLLMGWGIEALQALLPWRSAEWLDAAVNALGVAVGALVLWTPLRHGLRWAESVLRRVGQQSH